MKMIGQGPFKKYVRKKVFLIKLLISEFLQKFKNEIPYEGNFFSDIIQKWPWANHFHLEYF